MKKNIFWICLAIILVIGILANILSYSVAVSKLVEKKPVYSVETSEKKIALSFDAAWGADNTKKLMEILKSYDANATFFLVGFWIDKYPEMVKELDDNGFEIGNHSENHLQMSKLSKEQIKCEIENVNKKIVDITGKTPCVFRPPFGDYNSCLVETVNELDMHAIQWTIDSLDWKELGVHEEVTRVLKKVEPGNIILFHNNAKFTPQALPEILEKLKKDGYELCSVSDLIYTEDYTVDSNGIQHKN